MPRQPDRAVSSHTYRMSSESRQQIVLRTFHRHGHPGITALGTSEGLDFHVVVDCATPMAELSARRLILTLDLVAERVDVAGASDDFYESASPDRAYLPGAAVPRILARLIQTDGNRRFR